MNHLSMFKNGLLLGVLITLLGCALLPSRAPSVSPSQDREASSFRSPSAVISCRDIFSKLQARKPIPAQDHFAQDLLKFKRVHDSLWVQYLSPLHRVDHEKIVWALAEADLQLVDIQKAAGVSNLTAKLRVEEGMEKGEYGLRLPEGKSRFKFYSAKDPVKTFVVEVEQRTGYDPAFLARAKNKTWEDVMADGRLTGLETLFLELYVHQKQKNKNSLTFLEASEFIDAVSHNMARKNLLEQAQSSGLLDIVETKGEGYVRYRMVSLSKKGFSLVEEYLNRVGSEYRRIENQSATAWTPADIIKKKEDAPAVAEVESKVTFSHVSPMYTMDNLKAFKQINDKAWSEILPGIQRHYQQTLLWSLGEKPMLMKDVIPLFSSPEFALAQIQEGVQRGYYAGQENLKTLILLEPAQRYFSEVKERSGYSPEKVWRAKQSAWNKYFSDLPPTIEGALFELYLQTLKRQSEDASTKETDLARAFLDYGVDSPTRIRLLEKAAAAHLVVRTKGATTFRNTVELTEEGRVLLQYYLKDVADQLR